VGAAIGWYAIEEVGYVLPSPGVCSWRNGPRVPSGGQTDYPRNWRELLAWFPDDGACLRFLERLRRGEGFVCRFCGAADAAGDRFDPGHVRAFRERLGDGGRVASARARRSLRHERTRPGSVAPTSGLREMRASPCRCCTDVSASRTPDRSGNPPPSSATAPSTLRASSYQANSRPTIHRRNHNGPPDGLRRCWSLGPQPPVGPGALIVTSLPDSLT